MHIESILRRLHPLPGFVYEKRALGAAVEQTPVGSGFTSAPRKGSRGMCSKCFRKRPGYDMLDSRFFAFVPLWGLAVFLVYAMRRVDCPRCGVTVEAVPWAAGKMQTTHALVWFLASWAKVLSWTRGGTPLPLDLGHRLPLRRARRSLGAGAPQPRRQSSPSASTNSSWKKRHKYLTLVYQIDHGCDAAAAHGA